jgi:hypothetical protein
VPHPGDFSRVRGLTFLRAGFAHAQPFATPLWTGRPPWQEVSRALRKSKGKPSRQLSLGFAAGGAAFWQRRFYDFNVWSDQKLQEKLDYMHRNAVQRKSFCVRRTGRGVVGRTTKRESWGLFAWMLSEQAKARNRSRRPGNVKNRTLENASRCGTLFYFGAPGYQ